MIVCKNTGLFARQSSQAYFYFMVNTRKLKWPFLTGGTRMLIEASQRSFSSHMEYDKKNDLYDLLGVKRDMDAK